jgi:hypothetical protein
MCIAVPLGGGTSSADCAGVKRSQPSKRPPPKRTSVDESIARTAVKGAWPDDAERVARPPWLWCRSAFALAALSRPYTRTREDPASQRPPRDPAPAASAPRGEPESRAAGVPRLPLRSGHAAGTHDGHLAIIMGGEVSTPRREKPLLPRRRRPPTAGEAEEPPAKPLPEVARARLAGACASGSQAVPLVRVLDASSRIRAAARPAPRASPPGAPAPPAAALPSPRQAAGSPAGRRPEKKTFRRPVDSGGRKR